MFLKSAGCVLVCLSLVLSTGVLAAQDPTRPPDARAPEKEVAPPRKITLGSILLAGDRRVAVIEGTALEEGESYDGIHVHRIHRNKVEVTDQGQYRVLYPETLPQVRKSQ